jgi:DNA-binding transcriptional LysR family regulator
MDERMTQMDWSLVQAFLAVAETGSLSAAARRLGSSQPTLGRQIKAIEAQLGAELFHRHAKGFDLSETGAALLEPARSMRDAARQIGLTAAGRETRIEGTVRITASVVVTTYLLPEIVARIRAEEPDIEIELAPSDDATNLAYREADIAIRMFRPTQLDLVTRRIGDMPLGLFASHRYIEMRGVPTTAADLLEHDVIGFDRDPAIVDGFRAGGLAVERRWFKTRTDDQIANWQLVRAGVGIGFMQRRIGLADPLVREIPLDLGLPVLPVWLTAHEAMRKTPRVRRVWGILEQALGALVS